MLNHQTTIDKVGKLRELVMFKMANYKQHPDYIWSCRTLESVQDGIVLNKEDLIFANLIWKKYNGGGTVKTLRYNYTGDLKKDARWYLSNMKRYLPGIKKDMSYSQGTW